MKDTTSEYGAEVDGLIHEAEMTEITERIRKFALEHVDTVGFAPASRFMHGPEGRRPTDLMPHCKTAIVFTAKHLDVFTRTMNLSCQCYSQDIVNHETVHMAYTLSRFMEKQGFEAFPLIASHGAWPYVEPKETPASISLRHAGELAGLGMIGWNTMLITPEFGPRVQVGVILTDVVLTPTPLLKENPCNGCGLCVKHCASGVLEKPKDGQQYVPIFGKRKCGIYPRSTVSKSPLGRKNVCAICRAVCPIGKPAKLPKVSKEAANRFVEVVIPKPAD